MDDPEDEAQVLNFLEKQGAAFDNLISTYGIGEKAAIAFDMDGAVPHYKIYDRNGSVVRTFNDGHEADSVIDELVQSN